MAHYLLFVLLGAAFGFVAGLFGTSGGIVAVPVLAVFFRFAQQTAQGTALVMIVPNLALGFWRYYREGDIDRRMAFVLAGAAIPFAIAAAVLATRMPHQTLRLAFAIFAVVLAAFIGLRLFVPENAEPKAAPWGLAAIPGAVGGSIAGLFSSGGSIFCVAALDYFFGLAQVAAQGMAIVVDFPATVMALATFGLAHDVDWLTGVSLAAGGATTVHLGARLAHRLPERLMRTLFFAYVAAAAVGLFLKHS